MPDVLLRVEGRDHRDDFWLPELEELLGKAIDALEQGLPAVAERFRTAAVAVVWRSPLFTWSDRDRVIQAVHARFDAVAGGRRGASGVPEPQDLTELVNAYGPDPAAVLARGPLTTEEAFGVDLAG